MLIISIPHLLIVSNYMYDEDTDVKSPDPVADGTVAEGTIDGSPNAWLKVAADVSAG